MYLTSNATQSVIVTLYERCVNQTNPYFTWLIEDEDNNQQYVFTATDFSNSPWSYNIFTMSVIDGASYGSTAGVIPLSTGQYYYRVYEMEHQYDLNIDNSVGEVESGIMTIEGTATSVATFTQSDDHNTVAVFKNL